jgi:hypothetical protein
MNPLRFPLSLLAPWLLACGIASAQTTYIPAGDTWSYLRGTAEASNPTSAWRQLGFVESGWSSGAMPFWYGDVLPGGTELTGMQNVHTTVFFRKTFIVSNPTEIGGLILTAKCDDGFLAWINGFPVYRYNVDVLNPTFIDVAASSVAEPPPVNNFPLPDPRDYLVSGTNVITIMGFNQASNSSDFGLDITLATTGPDATVPTITSINPPPGQVATLDQITVIFTEPVRGVTPDDLVINQTAASAVTGSGATWTFTFPQPPYGEALISWSPAHNISDTATPTHPFDETAPGTSWSYTLVDSAPPLVAGLNPPAGSTVNALAQIEITFNEAVIGVNASDLLINGAPAAAVLDAGANKYNFTFPAQPTGPVVVTWAGTHGIADLAVPPNAFGGGSWSYTVDPNASLNGPRINEFVAANQNGLADEDGEQQDWIEIYNPTASPVNLGGWSLTDDPSYPDQWIFPARTLASGGYLIVFCSAKDRRPVSGNLHTTFKLSSPTGEYLALYDNQSPRQIATVFSPAYPEQRNDYSYGLDPQGVLRYYAAPTPNAANGASTIAGVTAEPEFSVNRGFFNAAFQLYLACPTAGASIRYTTDGSAPTASTGLLYSGPISINTTRCVRVAAFAASSLPSLVRTQTYVFPAAVKTQSTAPAGFPTLWGTGGNQTSADYEVDPNVTNDPSYSTTFTNDLQAIPSMSIVMKQEDLFGTTGINSNPGGSGLAWERAASLELIYPDGRAGFQQDCGMRIQGGFGRSVTIKKHSFRPLFKGDYGESKLSFPLFDGSPVQDFDTFTLRAGMNNSYVLSTGEAGRATFTEDEWMRQTQRAMGQVSGYGNFVHLYLNGLYWGLYNATERPSAPFAAEHLGGEKAEWDALNSSEAVDGNKTAWTTLLNLCSSGANARYIVDQAEWNQVVAYLDVDNFIDYMLLNFYGGNQDWDDHNWYAARRRVAGAGYKFFSWDGERTLETPTGQDKTGVNQADKPSRIYAALRGSTNTATAVLNSANVEFRLRFADRIQKQMFVNGPLTPTVALNRWNSVEAQLDRAVVGESARWGDKLREPPYTRNAEFLTEVNRKRSTQFPQRTASVLTLLRTAKLYPPTNLVAPTFNQHGGKVAPGFGLTMSSTTAGTIYYTLNGADPRQSWTATSSAGSAVDWSGSVAAGALSYGAAVPLSTSAVVKARVRETATGLWSALSEATFQVSEIGVPVRITELMYNPIGGDTYEFIELQNVGVTAVDLGLMRFEGIDFTFLRNTTLAAGARLVLASSVSPAQWALRYPGVTPAGYFSGALSNAGEYLALLDTAGNVVTSVFYDDNGRWPTSPDGGGRSLELVDFTSDPGMPESWRASLANNGTPGAANQAFAPAVRFNEVLARNAGAVTNGAFTPDYIELFNPSAASVNIGGWSVRPYGFLTGACVFPGGTSIPAGGFLVVWCGQTASGFHADLALPDSFGVVTLNDNVGTLIDAVNWAYQVPDKSIGLIGAAWQLTEPSPGATNAAALVAAASQLAVNEFLAQPDSGLQWVEFFNRDATRPIALTGISVQIGGGIQRIRTPSYLPPGGYARYFLGDFATSYQLDLTLPVSNGAITLYDAAANALTTLSYATSQPDVSQGRLPNGTGALTSFPLAATPEAPNALLNYSGPVLNEVLARNAGAVLDAAGNWPDFIEFFNPGASSFDMTGMKLRRDIPVDTDWIFPAGSIVPAGGYLRLWCDPSRPTDSTNIGRALADDSGGVWLFTASGQAADAVEYGPQVANLSIGKSASVWRLLSAPTPGAANASNATLGAASNLRINEWMASPSSGEDWLELFNLAVAPVEMSGLYLTDDPSIGGRTNTQIPPLSFIAGRGYAVFLASGDSTAAANATNFKIAAEGESLRLYSAAFVQLDGVDFGPAATGVSRGRYPDGATAQRDFPGTVSRSAANFIDTDGDGMPDDWEIAYGLNPLAAEALNDTDGDGASNIAEFRANTDPRDAASVLRGEIANTGSGLAIRFDAEQDRTYTVQFKNTLLDAAWQKLRDVSAGAARPIEIVDSTASGATRFYRIITPRMP